MPTITDWLMVVITAVYVVATIIISCANIKSANATREQLTESKRQYEDKKRLEVRPYFEVHIYNEFTDFRDCIHLALSSQKAERSTVIDRRISIKNIGFGPAKDVRYRWHNLDGEYDRDDLDFTAILQGETKDVYVDFLAGHKNDFSEYEASVYLMLTYSDLLENKYQLKIDLTFTISTEDNVKLTKWSVGTPTVIE